MHFNSKALQECIKAAQPILDNINRAKDAVSEDIKLLDKYLSSINLNESFTYTISDSSSCIEIYETDDFRMISSCLCTEEYLAWDSKKKRILFVQNEYHGTIHQEASDEPVIDQSSCKSIVNKPLIETTFEIRKRVYENHYLADFLNSIARKFDIHGQLNKN